MCAGIRRIAHDRLQDFRSLQGTRAGGAGRSVATPVLAAWCYPCVQAGQLICWRATNDDDEHYVYAMALS